MVLKRDNLAQVMLTSAFLFAITIAIITVMLNNLIYTNNIAYLGFMDQSNYDDLSIKQTTIDGMTICYSANSGDQTDINNYMTDFEKGLNSIMVARGKNVDITQDIAPKVFPAPVAVTPDVMDYSLKIFDKTNSKAYDLKTNYELPTTPAVGQPPANVIVRLACTEIDIDDSSASWIIVEVLDSETSEPVSNVRVSLTSTDADGTHTGDFDDSGSNMLYNVDTGPNGKGIAKYENSVMGTHTISPSIIYDMPGSTPPFMPAIIASNDVKVTTVGLVGGAGTCTHTWTHTVTQQDEDHQGSFDYLIVEVEVKIPVSQGMLPGYDFSKVGGGPRFEVTFTPTAMTNIKQISTNNQYLKEISDGSVASTTTDYTGHVWIKLQRLNKPDPYSVTLVVQPTAVCQIEPLGVGGSLFKPAPYILVISG